MADDPLLAPVVGLDYFNLTLLVIMLPLIGALIYDLFISDVDACARRIAANRQSPLHAANGCGHDQQQHHAECVVNVLGPQKVKSLRLHGAEEKATLWEPSAESAVGC